MNLLNRLKGNKSKKKDRQQQQPQPPPTYNEVVGNSFAAEPMRDDFYDSGLQMSQKTRRITFHCQLAHGSPTGIVSEFASIRELYEKIASCFDINPSDILFCTLNTHKLDMTKLIGGQLAMDDFIFAHVKGQPKEVDIEKTEDALGLTITDNCTGYAFIKSFKDNSLMKNIEGIYPGDHIEKINNDNCVGCRHYEIAKKLRELPTGTTFKLRVIEPLKSGFSEIGGKTSAAGDKTKAGYGTGKGTLRIRSKGPATIESMDDVATVATEKLNTLLESFLGISDMELAQTIWETGNGKTNPSDFAAAIDESDLREFEFTESFIFDLWGAITDAKQGRLQSLRFNS